MVVLWVLTIVNGFNLIDVMDGLATVVAVMTAVSFLTVAILCNAIYIAIMISVLLGGLIAFFLYNKPPASIYLGDAGSLFLGGFFAGVPLVLSWGTCTAYGYLVPPIFLAIPLLEVATLISVRVYKKIPFYLASPDHFSLYLQKGSWTKWQILLYVLVLSFVLLAVGFLFVIGRLPLCTVLVSGCIFILSWYIVLLVSRFYF